MGNSDDQINKLKKFLQEQAANEQDLTKKRVNDIMGELFESGRDEMKRITTDFEVEMPDESLIGDYVCLNNILVAGFKTPEEGENVGPRRPIFTANDLIFDQGKYLIVSPKLLGLSTTAYIKYIDEPAIIFREWDSKALFFFALKNESIAIKMSGLECFRLKPSATEDFDLEYVYLMMRAGEFINQFKQGINTKSLLKGWIPNAPLDVQKRIIENDRKHLLKGYFKS
jgi:hypothetical protein